MENIAQADRSSLVQNHGSELPEPPAFSSVAIDRGVKKPGWMRRINNASVYRTIRRAYRDCNPSGPVLLAPCGHGWFFDKFRRDGIEVVGIDIEKHKTEAARAAVVPPMKVVDGTILDMPFGDGEFEFVVSNRFILHFNDTFKAQAMRELARVTRRWLLVHYDFHQSFRQWGRALKGAVVPAKDFTKYSGYRAAKRQGRKLRYDRAMMESEGLPAGLKVRDLYFMSYLISERVYCLYEKA